MVRLLLWVALAATTSTCDAFCVAPPGRTLRIRAKTGGPNLALTEGGGRHTPARTARAAPLYSGSYAASPAKVPVVGKVYAWVLAFTLRALLLDLRADVRVQCSGTGNLALIRGQISDLLVDVKEARGPLLQLTGGGSFMRWVRRW